jgi:hypothetical protein
MHGPKSREIADFTLSFIQGGAQMTLYSGDPKISVLHHRLVWKPNFILPFGLGPDFILPFPAAAEENLGFIVGIFHFLTEKVNFIYITVWSGTGFHITVRPGTGFHITVPGFFGSGEYSVICAPPKQQNI